MLLEHAEGNLQLLCCQKEQVSVWNNSKFRSNGFDHTEVLTIKMSSTDENKEPKKPKETIFLKRKGKRSRGNISKTKATEEDSSNASYKMTPARVYVFNFFLFSALGSLMPFLPVFYGLLGFSSLENGLLYAVRPLISFWWGPLCASVATSTKFRQLLLFLCVAGAITSTFCVSVVRTNEGGILKLPSCQFGGGALPSSNHLIKLDLNSSVGHIEPIIPWTKVLLHNHTVMIDSKESNKTSFDTKGSWKTYITKSSMVFYRKLKRGIILKNLFWYILMLTAASELFMSPALHMAQATIKHNKQQSFFSNICLNRVFSKIGMAVSAISISYIAWKYQCMFKNVHYFYFHFYGFLATGCITAVVSLTLPRENPSKNSFLRIVGKGCGYVLSDVSILAYLFGLWVAGMAEGALNAYLVWFAASNGASELIIGMLVAIALITDVVLHWSVGFATKWIGHSGLLCSGIILMSIQFFVLTKVANPVYLIPCQLLCGLASSCIKSSLVSCAQANGSKEMEKILCFMFQGAYLGLGLGLGGAFVSMPYFVFGPVKTFTGLAIFTSCYSVLHIIIQCVACKWNSSRPKKAMYRKVDLCDENNGDWLVDALEEDQLQDAKEDFIIVEESEISNTETQAAEREKINNNI